jgi:hypothetical protein
MNALSSEQRARHRELAEQLLSSLTATRELADGYEFEFAFTPETYKSVTELTPLEHACCPFFTIAIRLDDPRLVWQLTGSEGVKPFIRMEFADWFK